MRLRGGDEGQATVELVAVLPLLLIAGIAVWQGVIAARTATIAAAGARAAARAIAVGADPRQALFRSIPIASASGARITKLADGSVRVAIPLQRVVIGGNLGRLEAKARFAQALQ